MTIEKLNLSSSVRSNFSFLENEFGFHIVREDPTVVRYESDVVFVSVFYEVLSIEKVALVVAIALLDQSRRDRAGYSIDHWGWGQLLTLDGSRASPGSAGSDLCFGVGRPRRLVQ